MCGCQAKGVRFTKSTEVVQEQFVVPEPTRKLMQSCDTRGNCGRVEINDFKTSEAAAVRFQRSARGGTGFPKETFDVTFPAKSVEGIALTSIGLRQLAEECASMADELDGQVTVLSLAGTVHTRKVTKKSKAKKKAANTKVKKIAKK